MKKTIFMILFLVISSAAHADHADLNGNLTNFFNGLGLSSNVSAPNAYHGQQAGYYSGGSAFLRSSVRQVQLVQMELPMVNAGCAGIDLFAGGISFVRSEELVKTMRNIMNNAAGFGMLLALEEVTPMIKNALGNMQDMANKVNQMNINSCEAAEGLVGGAVAKIKGQQQQVCRDMGNTSGMFSDFSQAREGCGSDGLSNNYDTTMAAAAVNPLYKNLVLDNGNLAWKALLANHLVNNNTQFAELLMSLSGSMIIRKAGSANKGATEIFYLASEASNPSLLKAILFGGDALIQKCDENVFCLYPQLTTVPISKDAALQAQVEHILISISQKIYTDTELSPPEIGLLQSTRIPIYKILAVQAAYQKDPNILNVGSYSELIATDILFQYLQENLSLVKVSASVLQYPADTMAAFNAGISQAILDVRAEQTHAQVQVSSAMQLIEQTQVIEKMLAGQLSVQLGNSLNFARSLR